MEEDWALIGTVGVNRRAAIRDPRDSAVSCDAFSSPFVSHSLFEIVELQSVFL